MRTFVRSGVCVVLCGVFDGISLDFDEESSVIIKK